ncbi:MAG TPA: glycine zipper 2TM domain-containing protein [Trinickia sp.]|jgi:outer membrane lipoprotein SlyB|uniref:glycine zipper 2TM domain-containing protein n=1 Tax=Trinickia sp. TaxID=2571163 RepID=UPI002CE8E269|nr:glycine zipper 2TM domain-containing protein [Trinickia sp.]HTI18599.1 glycine zipper 2TM domain-containing protein [Trinickia sp.]
MDHPSGSPRRLHPLIATAAAAVVVASLAATAAVTGLFSKASGTGEQSDQSQSALITKQAIGNALPPATNATALAAQPARAPQQQTSPTAAGQQQIPAQSPLVPATPPNSQGPYADQSVQGVDAVPTQQAYSGPQPYSTASQQAESVQQPYSPQQPPVAACANCGTVESIAAVRHPGHGTGIGAVGGALAGGLVGNQFGAGTGRTAMTILGAVGGGFAGNAVEKQVRSETDYQVRVRMQNGRLRYFTYRQPPPFQQGQPVRIEHGTLAAR